MMEKTYTVFVAIVGRPNVGKSSLLNAMVGEKVAIVTDKPQTTRTRVTGVLTKDETQYVFIDTPGLHRPRNKLGEYMVRQVRESIGDVDVVLMVTEAVGAITEGERRLAETIAGSGLPCVLAVNKVDLLEKKEEMLAKLAELSSLHEFADIIPISALTGDGISLVLEALEKYRVEEPHFFPDDAMTNQPERVIIAELIREKLLLNMRDEIPHGAAVVVEQMKERTGRDGASILDVEATILCEKESHKGMIIGKKGAMLKKIASEAREDAERFLDAKINLQCWVKVREDWRNKESVIRGLGFR